MTSRQAHGPRSRALLFSVTMTSPVYGLYRQSTGSFSHVTLNLLERQNLLTEARDQVSQR
jgi:hypothetical protein